ncbi:MAG: hypothetical protein FWB93_06520, partial [Oscillospiraceae bacterium]|nr:hypothetical protein [Oscillospiraceae bacterium]
HEPISPAESAREEIILGLRLSRGVAVERLPTEQVEKCVAEGLGKVSEGRFSLTPQGMLVCNRVIGEMLVSQK